MIEVLEPRVVLSASVPADIDQFIQNSSNPDGWYAALEILVPAVEQYAIGQEAAIDGYNSLIGSIAQQYADDLSALSTLRQTSLQGANDAFWGAVNSAEQSLTTTYNSAMTAYSNITNPANQVYEALVQSLLDDFNNDMGMVNSSGGGSGVTEEELWETMLTAEVAGWNAFIGVRVGAWSTFTSTMDPAVTSWTTTVDTAYDDREVAFASIRSSTDTQLSLLNAWLATDLALADTELQSDLSLVEGNWTSAMSSATAAWLAASGTSTSAAGMGLLGPSGNILLGAEAIQALWNDIRGLGQSSFDALESLHTGTWRFICEKVLADKPIASMMLDHSLQDNPPNLVFPSGHFVPKAIVSSGVYTTAVADIISQHRSSGPGTYSGYTPVLFPGGDLGYSIHQAKLYYILTLKSDGTYTLHSSMKDTYNFEYTWNYYQHDYVGAFGNAANNTAWASQHLSMIEDYDWTAKLPVQRGNW